MTYELLAFGLFALLFAACLIADNREHLSIHHDDEPEDH